MARHVLSFLLVLFLAGCSLPRVIVLHDPLDARQHNDLGVSYEAQGSYELALQAYEKAAEKDKKWARPLVNSGNVLAVQGQWAQAASRYKAALKRQPEETEAMNNLAWVLLQQDQLAQARRWAQRAVEAKPQNTAYQHTLEAIEIRQQAVNSTP